MLQERAVVLHQAVYLQARQTLQIHQIHQIHQTQKAEVQIHHTVHRELRVHQAQVPQTVHHLIIRFIKLIIRFVIKS